MAAYNDIPDIPQGGVPNWLFQTLSTLKGNVDILTGRSGQAVRAITNDIVSNYVTVADNQQLKQVTATGAGFLVSGVNVAAQADYIVLIQNVQQIANDLASVQQVLNALIAGLEASS